MTKIATHTLWKSADRLDPFTFSFLETLVGKAGLYIREHRSSTLRTFTLHQSRLSFTPDSDETRAAEDMAGEAFEGVHELGPVTRLLIHEADELTAQRESAGLTYDQPED